jgi:hypothetical protein
MHSARQVSGLLKTKGRHSEKREETVGEGEVHYCYYYYYLGARDGVVVKALRYKPVVAGSISDGVIGISQ